MLGTSLGYVKYCKNILIKSVATIIQIAMLHKGVVRIFQKGGGH